MPIPLIDPSQVTTNERLTRLEAIAEAHTKALTEIKAHIVRLEDHMHQSFRWLIGLMFLAWISTIVTILLKID